MKQLTRENPQNRSHNLNRIFQHLVRISNVFSCLLNINLNEVRPSLQSFILPIELGEDDILRLIGRGLGGEVDVADDVLVLG